MDLIVKMKFGSHLYGTNTEDSDVDYKGVFLPSKKEILLDGTITYPLRDAPFLLKVKSGQIEFRGI